MSTSTSTHILENVAVPQFERANSDHEKLSRLSRECHGAAARRDVEAMAALEAEVDITAARIWNITNDELHAIQDALVDMSPGRVNEALDDEDDGQ
jgi:hypothetical protein